MFDSHPGADQSVEHVFHRLERRQGGHRLRHRNERRDAVDLCIEPGLDRLEFVQQSLNALATGGLLRSPVLVRAAHFVGHAVVAVEQCQQGHMGVNLDQGREVLGAAGVGVQCVAKGAAFGAQPVGDGAGAVGRWAVNSAAVGAETAGDGIVRSTPADDRSRGQWHVYSHATNAASRRQRLAGLQQRCRIRFAASGPGPGIQVQASGQIQKGGITGGNGPAVPARCGGLYQGDAARLMGRPGGIDPEDTTLGLG